MHPRGHPSGIGVPVQQVERELIVAQQVVVDHEGPDQVVGAQHVEGLGHVASFQEAAAVHLFLKRAQLLLVDEDAQLARLGEVHHGDEEGGGLDPIVALGRHVGQGRGEQRATQAVPDGVHLALSGRLLDSVECGEKALLHVILESLLRERHVGVDPGDHEYGMTLADRPADEAVLRAKVEDVELVDPGRRDQQRPLQHSLGVRGVLDQLHQVVLKHHLAGGDADVPPEVESLRIGHLDPELAPSLLQVGQEIV